MKKIGLVLMSVCVVFGLTACGADTKTKEESKETHPQKQNEELNSLKSTEYAIGETASCKGLHIKVNDVQFSENADDKAPDEGKQFVIVNVTLSSDADVSLGYTPYDFRIDADQAKSNLSLRPSNVKDFLVGGNLEKGNESVTGNLVGQVSKDAHSIKLEYVAAYWDNKQVAFTLK